MFTQTARFYDAMYSFKDYYRETEYLRDSIQSHKLSDGNRLLDVACGTGKHAEEFAKSFQVEGIDLDENLLAIARQRCPSAKFTAANMIDFDLGRQFDVVTCLFSAIGYAETYDKMAQAMQSMAGHLAPGGVLMVEPWLYRENYISPHLHMLTVDEPDLKIARISNGQRRDDISVIEFNYLIVTYDETLHEQETHELGLYSQGEYQVAMADAGLAVEYDPIGPMGRGMLVGVKPL